MNLKFAFAVNKEQNFDEQFFGFADNYMIYKLKYGKLEFVNQIFNDYKEKPVDIKVDTLAKELLTNNVKVIVSKNFGENLKLINEYFIPVRVVSGNLQNAINAIEEHLHWIEDELQNFNSGYKLFTINSGILKSSIEKK